MKISKNNLIFVALSFFILWQMLLPGYILTLDMIFSAKLKVLFSEGAFLNALPIKYILSFLNIFLTGYVVQKIVLVILFFSLVYIAYNFFPVSNKYYAKYWAALFYTVNPFVYERFLAGHWSHLFAYAFLPLFLHCLFKFGKNIDLKSSLKMFASLLLIGIFSLHFLVMAILVAGFYMAYIFLRNIFADKQKAWQLFRNSILGAIIFLLLSSYWIAPYLLHQNKSILNTFDSANWQAFKTASDPRLGTTVNVLALYGFWGENQPWANHFLWPKDHFILFSIVGILLLVLILSGLFHALSKKENRGESLAILLISIFAFIFSSGLGDTIFKNLNLWLFEHVHFWDGFRDTQKFSGWLVLGYAYFGGWGIVAITDFLKRKNFRFSNQVLACVFLLPLLYTYTMLGGFAGQLQPVDYPASWYQANEFLNSDSTNFKVIFLPWHEYMSLNFNNNIINANPAKSFFDKPVIQGENMEISGIFSQTGDLENKEVERLILDKTSSPEAILAGFKALGIKYIVFDQDLAQGDYLEYRFLASDKLKEIHFGHLTIFQIVI